MCETSGVVCAGSGQLLPSASMDRAAWLHVNMTTPGASPCHSPDPAPPSGSNSRPHTPDNPPCEQLSSQQFPTHLLQPLDDNPPEQERFTPCLSPSSSPSCRHCIQNCSPDRQGSTTHRDHSTGPLGIENCSSSITKPPRSRLPSLHSHAPDQASTSAGAAASAAACHATLLERSNLETTSSPPSRLHALPSLPLQAEPLRLAGEACTLAQPLAARQQLESTTYSAAPCSDILGDLAGPADRATNTACQPESTWVSEIRSPSNPLRMPCTHAACGAAGLAGRAAAAVRAYPGSPLMAAAGSNITPQPEAGWWREPGCLSPGRRTWPREDMPPATRDLRRLPPPLHVRRPRCVYAGLQSVPSRVSRG